MADESAMNEFHSKWANKYRGVSVSIRSWPKETGLVFSIVTDTSTKATVEDLDPPSALSVNPSDPTSYALLAAFERDYTHLTVVSKDTRALIGYLSIPGLKELLKEGKAKEDDPVSEAMVKFRRKKGSYKVITMDTSLEELEEFFMKGSEANGPQEFAVVTDLSRRFVLGVATVQDLEEFARRRPA